MVRKIMERNKSVTSDTIFLRLISDIHIPISILTGFVYILLYLPQHEREVPCSGEVNA